MKGATPADILYHITMAIGADIRRNGYDGPELPIPIRIYEIVEKAITKANDEAEGKTQ